MSNGRLESAINSVVNSIESGSKTERNIIITMQYLGFDGNGGTSMEEAGKPHGLTRESVRQITNRVCADLKPRGSALIELKEAIEITDALLPSAAEDLEIALINAGYISTGFKIEGIINAANVFGIKTKMEQIVKLNGKRFITSEKHIDIPKKVQSKATKEISHNGAVSIDLLTEEVPGLSQENKIIFVNRVIDSLGSVSWIDKENGWFYFDGKGRNRLLARLRKIFAVMKKVQIADLRSGVERSWNKNIKDHSSVLPAEVMVKLITTCGEFKIEQGGFVTSLAVFDAAEELRPFEQAIVDFIKNKETGTSREKELEDNLVINAQDKFNFSMALNYSPLILKKERGVYALVGTPI